MLNEILVTANPRPVAMYRAPPKVKLLEMECDEIWVEKISNAGDREPKCLARRLIALMVPRSTNSTGTFRLSQTDIAEGSPCRNRGKKAIMNTKKILMMERSIHENTGVRL